MRWWLISAIATILLTTAAFAETTLRVVSLSPSLTELMYHLGRGEWLVGRSDACDYPAEAKAKPIAGKFADPHLEAIIGLRPDLVIANDLMNPGIIKTLDKVNIRVEVLPGETLEEYRACVVRLGELLSAKEAAAAEVARIDALLTQLPPPLPIKVLWVIWDAPPMVGGKNSLPDALIRLTGAENIAGNVDQPYFKCSFDWLLENQPDVIIWCTHDRDISEHRIWKQMRAIRENRVVSNIDPDIVLRPGPRLLGGVAFLRQQLAAMAKQMAVQ